MNSRQRFLNTLCGGEVDHPPLFPEGIRDEVLTSWKSQGLPRGKSLRDLFYYDHFEEISPDVYPRPDMTDWSDRSAALRRLRQRLDPDDPRRLPEDWARRVREWKQREAPLFVCIHEGLFLTLGIEDWRRFAEAMQVLVDDPPFVREVMAIQADFATRLAENILREVDIDAVIFSEPIAGNHGPLISPRMYRDLALSSYTPVFDLLDRYHVPAVIWRSYANPACLIPEVARSRFTAIWACDTPPEGIDFAKIRKEIGSSLGLMGGIDVHVLKEDEASIRQAVEALIPLVQQGRCIPLADGRVREEIPFAKYVYYRHILESLFVL